MALPRKPNVRFYTDTVNPLEQVDIIINYDLTGKRTTRVELASGPVRVLSIEDLIAMKRESGRPQDIEDIRALEQL